MFAKSNTAIAVLLLYSKAALAAGQFCSSVQRVISSDKETNTVRSYCRSYLGVRDRTITITPTTTTTSTSTTTSTNYFYTATFDSSTLTRYGATTSTPMATVYVTTALTSCPSPTSAAGKQRRSDESKPSAFSKIPNSSLSKACSCLSLSADTTTITARPVTSTVTRTTTHTDIAESVYTTYTVTTSYSTIATAPTETVTIAVTGPFGLLDSDTQKFANNKAYSSGGTRAYFSVDTQDEASLYGLTQSGKLRYGGIDGLTLLSGAPYGSSSGWTIPTWGGSNDFGLTCHIARADDDGTCSLSCLGAYSYTANAYVSGSNSYWILDFEDDSPAFTIYTVGGLTS